MFTTGGFKSLMRCLGLALASAALAGACNQRKEDAAKFKPMNSGRTAERAPAASQPAAAAKPREAPPPRLTPEQARGGELPPGHPPVGGKTESAPSSAPAGGAGPLAGVGDVRLDGLAMTVPQDWKPQAAAASAFPPKLQYALPKAEGDAEDAVVKVFHFPNMKGEEMDRQNIERWIGQFELPPGTARPAPIESSRNGITLKRLDMTGTLKSGGPMSGGGAPQENYRMIAAIVSHPAGPHHIKVTGPKATMARWESSIDRFLDSIQPAP